MVATHFTRSERRAQRWMSRRGLGLQPSEAAFDVLAARLDVRFRAGLALWPTFAVFYTVWTVGSSPGHLQPAVLWLRVARSVAPVLVFGVVFIGFTAWCSRSDRAIARALASRVTRTGAVPARVVLGPIAVAALVGVAVLDAGVTVLLALGDAGEQALAFGIGLLVVAAIVGVVLRFVLHRPTVAVDTSGLALDERLRALDALFAVWPLGWTGLALLGPLDLRGVDGSSVIVGLAAASSIVGSVVLFSHPAERVRYRSGRFRSPA